MISCTWLAPVANGQPAAANVGEIQAKHDRSFIQELTEYLHANPKAADRDQAYEKIFNKVIEHDWFGEAEQFGHEYLKAEPDGPVKALAQIVLTMARASAGQFDVALARYRELMQGLGQIEHEEFAASFSDNFAAAAISAGEFNVAREVYSTILAHFKDSPNLRQKIAADMKRLERVGKPVPSVAVEDINGRTVRLDSFRGKYVLVDFWATWCVPCIAELPRLQAAYAAYKDAGFEIVAVSLDESKTAVTDFVKTRKLSWTQIHNSPDLVEAFGVVSIPATYLVDPEGTIIRLDLRGKALDETLARLIKGRSGVARAR
jgi:thiol-disulfide isomerase/thioredoxin